MTDLQNYEQEFNQYQESLKEFQDFSSQRRAENPHEYTKSSRSTNRRQNNNKKHKRQDTYY